jgi:dinuclear metal center YbgI/SA1388 family protein
MVLVGEVLAAVQRAYPVSLAEEWDGGIGLTCGDPHDEVGSVLLAVDVDAVTVDEAIESGAGLLLTHHPLLFRPVQSVAADTPKGALLHRMIRAGVAHIAAHTNADSAVGGVNEALAAALRLTIEGPLVPSGSEPGTGSGRVGRLSHPMSLRDFVAVVARVVPATVSGVRAAGDPFRTVERVAVCGGAGDSLMDAAAAAGVDVYLTSDLRHHVVAEFIAVPGHPAVVEVAHWAGEWPWLDRAAELLGSEFPGLRTTVSTTSTDPWTIHTSSTPRN